MTTRHIFPNVNTLRGKKVCGFSQTPCIHRKHKRAFSNFELRFNAIVSVLSDWPSV